MVRPPASTKTNLPDPQFVMEVTNERDMSHSNKVHAGEVDDPHPTSAVPLMQAREDFTFQTQ